MKSKIFKEILKNLESELKFLMKYKPVNYREVLEIKAKIKIQRTKISFIKKGYGLKEKELKQQQKLR